MKIQKDDFLSSIINKNSYRLVVDSQLEKSVEKIKTQLYSYLKMKNVFIYVKCQSKDLHLFCLLQQFGFKLADVNVVFEKCIEDNCNSFFNSIRFAELDDQKDIIELAKYSFKYSRFHMDSKILPDHANLLKSEWANNYFLGKRGDSMIVGTYKNKIYGFLLLLVDKEHAVITIDLIAVNSNFRKKNFAREMILFAEKNFSALKKIRVGTQLINVPSMNLYESLGFKVCNSYFVLHYHS